MYLRWKTRCRRYKDGRYWDWHVGAWRSEAVQLTAVLVTASRVEGKPRQQYVATLGSIDIVWLGQQPLTDRPKQYRRNAIERRIQFLRWARNKTHDLITQGVITAEQRDAFLAQLQERVPPPTEEELADVSETMREIWAMTPEQDAAMVAAFTASLHLP